MESDEEIKGKAYVHWKSWQDAYKGIVDQSFRQLQVCRDDVIACNGPLGRGSGPLLGLKIKDKACLF